VREGVPLLEIPSGLDRSKGDIHAAGNPHYTTDPATSRSPPGTFAIRFARLTKNRAITFRKPEKV